MDLFICEIEWYREGEIFRLYNLLRKDDRGGFFYLVGVCETDFLHISIQFIFDKKL